MLPVVGTGAHPTLPRLDAGVRVPRVHTLECLRKERKRRLVRLYLHCRLATTGMYIQHNNNTPYHTLTH